MDLNKHTLVFLQRKDDEYCRRNLPYKYHIYALKVGEDLYIGSSIQVITRIRQHVYEMTNGTHCNEYMNKAFLNCNEVYGYVLDSAESKSEALRKEQYYIDLYEPYLNIGTANSRRGDYSYTARKWNPLPRKKTINYPIDRDSYKKMLDVKSQLRLDFRELSYVAMKYFLDRYFQDGELTADGIRKIEEIMFNVDSSKF